MKAEYENHYLGDNDVANYARQSFDKRADEYTDEQNHSLIRFLARGVTTKEYEEQLEIIKSSTGLTEEEVKEFYFRIRNTPTHWSAFGHPHATFRISAPIPIARQMFKHKVGTVESEESRRYISVEPRFFFPKYWRPSAKNVKQGSEDVPHELNDEIQEDYKTYCETGKQKYLHWIEKGLCPEQARLFLPQGTIVNWVLTGSLYALANMYIQRSDSHAQKEIQDLIEDVSEKMKELYPVSWAALTTPAGV